MTPPKHNARSAMLFVLAWTFCVSAADGGDAAPVDKRATPETVALFHSLRAQMGKGILFGHENTTLYGIGWHSRSGAVKGRSDVKSACGVYPAVYGWDLNVVWNPSMPPAKRAAQMRDTIGLVVEAYERGGVNTFSWHMWNPVTKKNFYDTTPAVKAILPGGAQHNWYLKQLDLVSAFFGLMTTTDGVQVPIIFRPFHEHNLKCFWWCVPNTTQADYNRLYRFTVEHLRDTKGVHNLLYATSPSGRRIKEKDSYLKLLPGRDYVDIYGVDCYVPDAKDALQSLLTVVRLSDRYGKIAAWTEGGYPKGLTKAPADYFTAHLLAPLKADATASRVAYFMTWQNSKPEHHWIPIKGEKHMPAFVELCRDPLIIMGNSVPPMYRARK